MFPKCFQELKKKIPSTNCLGAPRPKGKITVTTDDGVGWVSVLVRFTACVHSAHAVHKLSLERQEWHAL